jgi:hypothetical protein
VWSATLRSLTGALVALPPDSVTGDPTLLPSTANCTVPVGVPDPGDAAETVAVNETGWPNTEGFALDEKPSVTVSWPTFTVAGTVVADAANKLSLEAGANEAVTVSVPTGKEAVEMTASPLLDSGSDPTCVAWPPLAVA